MCRQHKLRWLSLLVTVGYCSTVSGAGDQEGRAKLPPELEPVYAIALAAPPEFASSALLRLNARVADQGLRRELLEMAFHLAAKAQNPVRLVSFPGSDVDTRTGSLSAAFRLKLDALSLASWAVRDMAVIDPGRARKLFEAMPRPKLSVVGCEGSLLPDVSPYYDALAAVAQENTFSQPERANPDHLAFAVVALGRNSAIAELEPATRTLASLGFPPPQFKVALGSFASKFESVPPDARSFRYFAKSIDDAVALLVARARQLGVAPGPLIDAYRGFLLVQFSAPHCGDSGTRFQQITQQTTLFGETIRGGRPTISSEEMTRTLFEGEMKLDTYWQTDEAGRIHRECQKLRQGPQGYEPSEAAQHLQEWKSQLTDFLSRLASWWSNDENSEWDYYHQKAVIYEELIESLPSGELSDSAIGSFISFLKSSDLQQRNAAEWFSRARSMVDRVRSSRPEQAAKILAAYRSSGNVILMLEAMLEQVAPARS